MASEPCGEPLWSECPLSDLTSTNVTYGVVQPGASTVDGIPMIRVNNFNGHSLNLIDVMKISPAIEIKYERTRLRAGDVLITVVGSVGQVAIVPPELSGWNIARAVALIRPKNGELSRWIAHFLRSPIAQHRMGIAANTTVQTTVNLKDLRTISIPMPSAPVREGISELLGVLDDRIDVLEETNTTLEAIAQTMFKSWFVDFDPVRAKVDGRDPEGMDSATASLFASEFQSSELGMIPKEWRVGTLRDICRVHDSKRIPLSGPERERRRGIYPYYGAAAVVDFVDDYLFDGVYVLLAEDGSIATKSGFALTQYVWGRIWVNNHAHVLEGANGFSTEQLLLMLQRVQIGEFITGAVQAKLSQSNMFRIPAIISPPKISESFAELTRPLFLSIRQNCDRIKVLSELRDILLPRLMSGKLRLPEAECLLKEAPS